MALCLVHVIGMKPCVGSAFSSRICPFTCVLSLSIMVEAVPERVDCTRHPTANPKYNVDDEMQQHVRTAMHEHRKWRDEHAADGLHNLLACPGAFRLEIASRTNQQLAMCFTLINIKFISGSIGATTKRWGRSVARRLGNANNERILQLMLGIRHPIGQTNRCQEKEAHGRKDGQQGKGMHFVR